MKKELPFTLVLIACLGLWLSRSINPAMLLDSDTAVLLDAIRERQSPLSWFGGDWPLANHFYRPVSTLFFELDARLFGNDAAGYGATQALIAVGCVLALYWFVRELSDRRWLAAVCALLFVAWHFDAGPALALAIPWLALGVLVVGGLRRLLMNSWHGGPPAGRPREAWRNLDFGLLAAPLLLAFFGRELMGHPIRHRIVEWLPGRTASVMTLFALLALAAYARYERLRHRPVAGSDPSDPRVADASPFDLPATRSTVISQNTSRAPWAWALGSCAGLALALGSYEQAVMLPAALLGVAVTLSIRGVRPKWSLQIGFWAILLGYLVLRRALVPGEVSGYQAQQFRDGPGVWLSLLDYAFPAAREIRAAWTTLGIGIESLLVSTVYSAAILLAGNLLAIRLALRDRDRFLGIAGYGLSVIAFLPMAWLKPFDHYHYWPMAMRALLVVWLGLVAARLCLTALSPPAVQAPQRRPT